MRIQPRTVPLHAFMGTTIQAMKFGKTTMKEHTKNVLKLVGRKVRPYLIPGILWGIGLYLTFQMLQLGNAFPIYIGWTESQWVEYANSYETFIQGYAISEMYFFLPVRFVFAILFLYFAYRLTPR